MVHAKQRDKDGGYVIHVTTPSITKDVPGTILVHVEMSVAGYPRLKDEEIDAVVALVRARLTERRDDGFNDCVLR